MRIRTGIRRTTTQMLNHSRRKTNLSASRRSSLLSAARKNAGLNNTRLGMMMNANSIQSARLLRSNYEKLEKSATSLEEQLVVYSYVALGGFLWSLWAIYKSALGEEFGEYTIIMYRYAKGYYRKIAKLHKS